jgi:hypothetical protein
MPAEHAPHRGRGHRNTDPAELADNPQVTPARVLTRKAKDQRASICVDPRPPARRRGYIHRHRTRSRCQRTSVSGDTINPIRRSGPINRASDAR